ncbi:hypothetical protein JCM8208_002365 [Rhodotorula glutinis]
MKATTFLVAAAALSLPLVAQAHGPDSAAHSRRFNRVLRGPEDAPVIDLELSDSVNNKADFVVRNASLVAQGGDSDGHELHSLSKRGFNGRATFFEPGLGACGTYSGAGDFMVAMNQAQYGDLGAVSSWCFQTITITYGGKTANAQVLDACPGCPYGGLDMSPALFRHFADESVGVIYMSWSAGGGGGGGNNNNNDDQKSKEAAAAASSSSAAAAYASSQSAAAAWASSSSSRAAAWASSSSQAHNAWLASSSSSAAAAAASSASAQSVAAQAAQASRASAQSVASVASAAAAAQASDAALSVAAASAASVASVASAAAESASAIPSATMSSSASLVSGSASASASSSGGAVAPVNVATPSIPAGAVGGNLDSIAQLVIAMGNVVAAKAANAE